jgi:hypothetical protein
MASFLTPSWCSRKIDCLIPGDEGQYHLRERVDRPSKLRLLEGLSHPLTQVVLTPWRGLRMNRG